jgi:hypothetical protein
MKRLAIYILSIVCAVAVIDYAAGLFFNRYTKTHSLKGDYDNLRHILYDGNEQLVVFGSSVALNSINTKTLSDSLGVDCFNAASNGQTLFYHLVVMKSMLQRTTPKVILLGFKTQDLMGEGVGDRYNFLSPYYKMGFKAIDEGFERDNTEKVLMKSNLYRYNTIWWRILLYQFITPNEVGECGFIAKPIPSAFPPLKTAKVGNDKITEERLSELCEFIKTCKAKGVKLILFNPPEYINFIGYNDSKTASMLQNIAKQYGVTLFDDTQDEQFLQHPEYFYDSAHLNIDGSAVYTAKMLERVKLSNE